tara:strand:- start:9969 stop:10202 length:234 start_codon:yes stop_codon:yes gene_type:complete
MNNTPSPELIALRLHRKISCDKWRVNNKEAINMIKKQYYHRNIEKYRAYHREAHNIRYYYKNKNDEFLRSVRKLYEE